MTTEKNKLKYGLKNLQAVRGPMTFGRLLTSFRFSMEISQVHLAKKLGLSTANVCDLEKGRKIPSPARAAEIAKNSKNNLNIGLKSHFRIY